MKPKVFYVGICDTTREWHISDEMRTCADQVFVERFAYDALMAEAKKLRRSFDYSIHNCEDIVLDFDQFLKGLDNELVE
jgi:hypothetical protein